MKKTLVFFIETLFVSTHRTVRSQINRTVKGNEEITIFLLLSFKLNSTRWLVLFFPTIKVALLFHLLFSSVLHFYTNQKIDYWMLNFCGKRYLLVLFKIERSEFIWYRPSFQLITLRFLVYIQLQRNVLQTLKYNDEWFTSKDYHFCWSIVWRKTFLSSILNARTQISATNFDAMMKTQPFSKYGSMFIYVVFFSYVLIWN